MKMALRHTIFIPQGADDKHFSAFVGAASYAAWRWRGWRTKAEDRDTGSSIKNSLSPTLVIGDRG